MKLAVKQLIQKIYVSALVLAAVSAIGLNSFAAVSRSQSVAALEAISADYSLGLISLDDKVLLEVMAIRSPDKLPVKYQLDLDRQLSPGELRGATMKLVEIKIIWNELEAATQQALSAALARPTASFSYDSPSGFFKLHYDTSGTNAVSAEDTNSDGIPDYVERCAAYCDSSYAKHILLGYLAAPSDGSLGGDSRYDIYFENSGFYGYAVPEGDGGEAWNDRYSYIVLNNNFVGFPANNDPEGQVAGAAKATAAHEYHHAVQFAYDISEPIWFMEFDATYMEDIVFDLTDDNYNYLPIFMNSPEISLMENSNHFYSCFIWGLYLAQKFDTSLMTAIWEGARFDGIFNTLSDTLLSRYGWTQDSAFADFVTWNYVTAVRNDNLHHEEGGEYPLIDIGNAHSFYPVPNQSTLNNPEGYGSEYVQFFPNGNVGKLTIEFDGSNSRDWAVYIVKSITVNDHVIEKLQVDAIKQTAGTIVYNFENYHSVALIGINISEFSPGTTFSYSAAIAIQRDVATSIVNPDTVIYSGDDKPYLFQVFNPAAFDDLYQISYWDDSGWIAADSIMRAIGLNSDTIFLVNVHPPQGTPLSNTSNLHFKAQSINDTTVSNEETLEVMTVLYKGDSNFDGSITILDLTYIVDFVFRGGAEPIPIKEAGDFNCDFSTNILDLTKTVDYIFRGGSLPPCNPY